jgi:Tol biopolymer transport system component/predicted Ser/Thr protein kinase
MRPMHGQRLLHYEVLETLGEGGMGVVYKAADAHLDRFVAIKVLRPHALAGADHRSRFIREARAVSALHHPNIITIHDITSVDDVDFIVMEYVDGRTLDALIQARGMRLDQLLKVAIQIADALAAAHAGGIVHRDLKPSNVMVTGNGMVKVLDFGLAKRTGAIVDQEGATRTAGDAGNTGEGAIVGTIAYMSPEQAEGLPVDSRSDIFSFGICLYEMTTGRHPFRAGSSVQTLSALMSTDPPLPSGAPQELARVISRCLRKDPQRRFQHLDDVAVALRELKEESDSSASGVRPAPAVVAHARKSSIAVGVTALAVVTASGVWWWLGWRAEPDLAPVTVAPLTTYPGYELTPAFSPDGKQVAFGWGGPKGDNIDIYVALIGTGTPHRLTTHAARDACPAWSPDGRSIAFVRGGPGPRKVILTPALGGPERVLSETIPNPPYVDCGLDWSRDGRYVAFPWSASTEAPAAIVMLSPDTGERRTITAPRGEAQGDMMPRFSPAGQLLAFLRRRSDVNYSLYVASIAAPTDGARRVTPESANVTSLAWTPDGRELVFTATYKGENRVWRMPADGSGSPTAVAAVGANPGNWVTVSLQGNYLAYSVGRLDTNIWRVELELGKPTGAPMMFIGSTMQDLGPHFSPDGSRVVFSSDRSGVYEVWTCAADGSNQAQLTRLRGYSGAPRWSPDGRTIAFDSSVEGQNEIFTIGADGGPAARITNHPGMDVVPTWSRDSRWIYFTSDRSGAQQIWKIPADGGTAVQMTRHGGVNAFESAEGRNLYYAKGIDAAGVWRVPIHGGDEQPLLKHPAARYWGYMDVTDAGIYYLERAGEPPSVRYSIRFHNLATGRDALIADYQRLPYSGPVGLAVSPDGRALLYSQIDRSGTDLMLVENFR